VKQVDASPKRTNVNDLYLLQSRLTTHAHVEIVK